jgi:hypothetical protein
MSAAADRVAIAQRRRDAAELPVAGAALTQMANRAYSAALLCTSKE